jgi:tRNA(Ser,Leu) C12 N-acetylase TAN1
VRVTDEMVQAALHAIADNRPDSSMADRMRNCLEAALAVKDESLVEPIPFVNAHLEARLHRIEQAVRALAAMDEDWKPKTLAVTATLRPDQEGDPA